MSFGVFVSPRSAGHSRDLLLRMEDTEFDTAWVGDTLGDGQDRSAPMLDTWVTLGAIANDTDEIDLGMLVTNLAWRDPVQVARFAMTVDQLSNGRFVLGLGSEQLGDQRMAGHEVFEMPPKERVDRLDEGVQVIDRLLRGDVSPFKGTFVDYESAVMAPGCVQEPRLPILVAGNGERELQIAVEHADTWNTRIEHVDVDQFYAQTAERVALLDRYLEASARDTESLTRSLMICEGVINQWASNEAIPSLVERFQPLGFTEFIFHAPVPEQLRDFLRIAIRVLPGLRN